MDTPAHVSLPLRRLLAGLAVLAVLMAISQAIPPSAAATPAPIGLKLPWDQSNSTVYLSSAPHGGATQFRCSEPLLRSLNQMSGLDFGMAAGTEILAAADGWVRYAQSDPYAAGKTVMLEHAGGFVTQYWHLSSIDSNIKVGDWVPQGRPLGRSGSAGTGEHLHLEFGTKYRPGNTPWGADGLTIDGYTAHALVRTRDGLAYNYQGTLTRGAPRTETITWCANTANSGTVTRWLGMNEPGYPTGTVYADEHGGGGKLRSTNQRNSVGNGSQAVSCPGQYKAEYFTNTTNPAGSPAVTRCEGWPIVHDWGGNSPDNRITADRFAARWSTRTIIDAGRQRFRLRADDGARVYIDGALVPELNRWHDQDGSQEYSVERVFNSRAEHDIRVEYYENGGGARISFRWEAVTAQPWGVSLTASATSIQPGQSVTLTATASQDVHPTPYFIRIDQVNANRNLWSCGSGATCTVTLNNLPAGSTVVARARIADGSGNNIQAESAPVTVSVASNSSSGGGAPSRSEVIVDDRAGGFRRGGQYWWEAGIGYASHMFWTYVNGNVTSSWGEWNAHLAGGRYEVFVFVPRDNATAQQATYSVYHAGGVSNRMVNQNNYYDAWVSLGTYDFAAGDSRRVRLTDATGEAGNSRRKLGFDAVKFTPR